MSKQLKSALNRTGSLHQTSSNLLGVEESSIIVHGIWLRFKRDPSCRVSLEKRTEMKMIKDGSIKEFKSLSFDINYEAAILNLSIPSAKKGPLLEC